MLPSIFVVIFAAIIAYAEIPQLLVKKLKKELVLFISLLFLGVGAFVMHLFDVKWPTPLIWIELLYRPIASVVSAFLQ